MSTPRDTPPRAAIPLSVSIDGWMLGDGSPRPPVVREIGEYAIGFREETVFDPSDEAVSELAGEAFPCGAPSVTGRGDDRRMRWPTRLRGIGWEAFWAAARPVVGPVRVRGTVYVDTVYHGNPVRARGRIRRVRIESVRCRRRTGTERVEHVPGTFAYRDVNVCPQWLDRALPPEDEYRYDSAAVVDLDLADAPAAEPRLRIYPTSVAVDGDVAWLIDRELPVVTRVELATGACTEYLLPGTVTDSDDYEIPAVWAASGNCWAFRSDGVFRIHRGAATRVSESPVDAVLVGTGTALVALREDRKTARLHLLTAGDADLGEPVHVGDRPHGGVASGGDFLLLTGNGEMSPEDRVYRLVRVDAEGQVTVGFVLGEVGPNPEWIGGVPARICAPDSRGRPGLLDVGRDLSVIPASRPGWCFRAVRTVDGDLFGILHPPDGTGPHGWWPLDGPCQYGGDDQCWLLVRLNSESLEPIAVTPIHATRFSVARHGDDVLVATGTGLFRWRGTGFSELEELPVAARLDEGD